MESFSLVEVPVSLVDDLPDRRSSVTGGVKRIYEEDLDNDSEGIKRVKMRDLSSVLQSEGLRKCSTLVETKPHGHDNKESDLSQITEITASSISDKPIQLKPHDTPEPNDITLSLGFVETSVQSSTNLISHATSKEIEETKGPISNTGTENEPDSQSIGIALDLNENIFYPYKKLGQVRSVDDFECGSSTGPMEESAPLRMWKEMKQNGFLSSSHGGIPIPKQRGRPAKRRKDEELKKKSEQAKKEQANKYTKLAAPTGLLSGLNPGIIKHVRNSKQVNSIIAAMLQSKREDQMQNMSMDQVHRENGSKEFSANSSAGNQFSQHPNRTLPCSSGLYMSGNSFYHEKSTASGLNSEYDSGSLALKLSLVTSMASQHASTASVDDFSASQDSLNSLSMRGASVASQWLDLLQQDIKGRLAALRRSKNRVRNVIQTELPYLLSREISSNQENGTNGGQSSEGGQPKIEILNMHMARWKSIFEKMDKALWEEGKHLETWLKRVQDMQSHCERGLTYFGDHGSSVAGQLEQSRGLNKADIVEREHAVRSSAASIYSTCNFIMAKENVPCC